MIISLLLLPALSLSAATGPKITVSGTVTSESDGEPLIGVSVLVKGTNEGVATDIDGNFALKVKNGDVISISYIGYKPQEIPVTGQNDIKVVLVEDTQMLEDVVVIGYGTARKKDLTGAVVQVNPDKIADQNPGSVQDVLRGVPGLQIGYDSSAKGQGASILTTSPKSTYLRMLLQQLSTVLAPLPVSSSSPLKKVRKGNRP